VSDCCTPKGYRQIFSEKNAAGEAKRYRRKGLDGTFKRIFDSSKSGESRARRFSRWAVASELSRSSCSRPGWLER